MAVRNSQTSTLKLKLQTGMNAKGEPKVAIHTFSHFIRRPRGMGQLFLLWGSWQELAPNSSLSPPNTRPAAGHADLIQLEAAFL